MWAAVTLHLGRRSIPCGPRLRHVGHDYGETKNAAHIATQSRPTTHRNLRPTSNGITGPLGPEYAPLSDLASVVLTPGGIGRGIAVSSPEQTSPGTSLPAPFWIYGPDSSTKFETMLNVWDNHKQSMLLPDNAFLMAYQLSPRFIEGGSIPQRDGLVARGAEEDVYRTCIN
jgi:hypothetical protein